MKNGSFDNTAAPQSDWQGKAVYVLVLVSAFTVALWLLRPEPPVVAEPVPTTARPTSETAGGNGLTIAETWRWPPAAGGGAEPVSDVGAQPASLFSEKAVADALGSVVLTEDGDVVVDKMALSALRAAFDTLPPDLGADDVAALQAMIRRGLPGKAGEQTAKIVGDYYGYRQALATFNAHQPTPTTPDAERERLEQLAELRQQHLGPVVATQFFAQDEAYERYIIERRRVESNLNLSAEEKAAQHAALKQNLLNGAFFFSASESEQAAALADQAERLRQQGASEDYIRYIQTQSLGLQTADGLPRSDLERQDWHQRYAQFQQERQAILGSGLTEPDKKAQIEQLMQRLLTADEIKATHAYEMK